MISDKSYNLITKTTKNVIDKLKLNDIKHEVLGDKYTFAIAPTCTIHTDYCTIDIWKDRVTVNEIPVNSLDEMINIVLEVEGTIPGLITCKECEGKCYTEEGKCEECWGTGLVSEQEEYVILREGSKPLKYGIYRTQDGMTNTSPYEWKLFKSEKAALTWANKNGLNIM